MAASTARGVRLVYTRWLFWADGMTLAPRLVLLHPRGRGDAGLLAHELVHCQQMRRVGTVRFWWRYVASRRFRLEAELEAYCASLRHHPEGFRHFAASLARGYFLGIPTEHAERLLRQAAAAQRGTAL